MSNKAVVVIIAVYVLLAVAMYFTIKPDHRWWIILGTGITLGMLIHHKFGMK